MKNKYIIGAHISERQLRKIVFYFSEDETATKTAKYTGVSRNSINKIFQKIRVRIAEISIYGKDQREFEVDESYFGARRVRGKRGRGAAGKTPVFGILKREGKVYVNMVKNCTRE